MTRKIYLPHGSLYKVCYVNIGTNTDCMTCMSTETSKRGSIREVDSNNYIVEYVELYRAEVRCSCRNAWIHRS